MFGQFEPKAAVGTEPRTLHLPAIALTPLTSADMVSPTSAYLDFCS
jgi:hypothetical protein